jgi:hypothetical protein
MLPSDEISEHEHQYIYIRYLIHSIERVTYLSNMITKTECDPPPRTLIVAFANPFCLREDNNMASQKDINKA